MGRIWRSLTLGMKSLLLHKLRSGLTVLGIVFGVAAVIAMLAVGEGASRKAQREFQELGATNIIYRSVKPTEETQAAGGRPVRVLNYGLKFQDFDRLIQTIPTIEKALPIRELRKTFRYLARSVDGTVVGTTADYMEFNHLEIDRGRFLAQSDNDRYENYCVLASLVAKELFPYEDPLGKSVKLGTDYYVVIGVTRQRASTAGIGGSLAAKDFNKDVYIPLNTCRLRFGERVVDMRSGSQSVEETQLSQITLRVHSTDQVRATARIVEAAVAPHHLKKDVELTVPYDLILRAEAKAREFTIMLFAIASISLMVGGIGIMNIMLATVTERTREIGIRRALGVKRRDITQQFLIETVVLSGIGGLIGIGVGVLIPWLIHYLAPEQETAITAISVLLAFGISVLIGILFGIYPANRAAKMDPIEALRHE